MSAPSAVQTPSRPKMDTKTMVSIAMLTGIAYIVMLLSKLMPSVMFLDFDFKDVVVCIGGFTFGPFAAAIISILVAFIEMLTISHTGPIGFIMNVLATCAFSCTACFIYKKVHSKKGAVLGLACGVACLVAVMLLWNYLITPLYMTGYSRADVAGLLPTLFLPCLFFNLFLNFIFFYIRILCHSGFHDILPAFNPALCGHAIYQSGNSVLACTHKTEDMACGSDYLCDPGDCDL